MNIERVCIDKRIFEISVLLLVLILGYTFIIYKRYETLADVNLNETLNRDDLIIKLSKLQNDLYTCQVDNQYCKSDLAKANMPRVGDCQSTSNGPIRTYDTNNKTYQNIGILYSGSQRFPLYGRRKYSGKR